MKSIILIVLLFLFVGILYAQEKTQDVVYLKNGSIIKGIIIEQIMNESIKIQMMDGSIFVYKIDEVIKIIKEPLVQVKPKLQTVLNLKSPGIAAALSVIIPGLGSMYAEEVSSGIAEMIFVYSFYGLYSADKRKGSICLLFGLGMHFLSIFEAYNNTVIYNKKLIEKYSLNILPINQGLKLTLSIKY
jgi:TM2 domain-containing membrane protein YozV